MSYGEANKRLSSQDQPLFDRGASLALSESIAPMLHEDSPCLAPTRLLSIRVANKRRVGRILVGRFVVLCTC